MAISKTTYTQQVIVMDAADVVGAFNLPPAAILQGVQYNQNGGQNSQGQLILTFSLQTS